MPHFTQFMEVRPQINGMEWISLVYFFYICFNATEHLRFDK